MKKLTLLVSLLFSVSFLLKAIDVPKIKFEKVSPEEMSMTKCPEDSTAAAAILFDDGSSMIKYVNGMGYILSHQRFVRIKILKQEGVDWGTFSIPIYSYNTSKEDLNWVKATTINLENGKMVKTEMKKDAIFRERENRYWERVRFTLPAVKVGSVIDVQYTINSNLIWNLRNWYFQYSIPVKWSRYEVEYPDYFIYNCNMTGYHPLSDKEENRRSDRQTSGEMTPMINTTYVATNIPALKEEPYLTTLKNYRSQLKFELSATNFVPVGGKITSYTTTWDDIARQLSNDDGFGIAIKGNGFLDDEITAITKEATTPSDKAKAIFTLVQNKYKWNGYQGIFTSQGIRKTYNEKSGSTADINLLLISMLKRAGLDVNPVVLSTRENGLISITRPSISDCNYVVAQVMLDGKSVLLDATDKYLNFGTLPLRCLNGTGRVIMEETTAAVPLSNSKSSSVTQVTFDLVDGKYQGKIVQRFTGLQATSKRNAMKEAGNEQKYFENEKQRLSHINLLNFEYQSSEDITKPLGINYTVALKDEQEEKDAETIYLEPLVTEGHQENPFTNPTRLYPVDFGNPFTNIQSIIINIPKGYKVEEVPKSVSLVLDGKGGSFMYQVSQTDEQIVVNTRFNIDRTTFDAEEYPTLRNFYGMMLNKQSEQIVLKRLPQ